MARPTRWDRRLFSASSSAITHTFTLATLTAGETITRIRLETYQIGGVHLLELASAGNYMGIYAYPTAGGDPAPDPIIPTSADWMWWGMLRPTMFYDDPTQAATSAIETEKLEPYDGPLDIKAQRGPAPTGGLTVKLRTNQVHVTSTSQTYLYVGSSALILMPPLV